MSEAVAAFQTQLSGLMETVFKAAIFEITRLVEASFLDEVSRSREQVEALKEKLRMSESRERRRCNCSATGSAEARGHEIGSPAQTGEKNVQSLKEERAQKSWGSCRAEEKNTRAGMAETQRPSTAGHAAGRTVLDRGKLDCTPKAENVQTAIGTEQPGDWKLSNEVPEISDGSPDERSYNEQVLQQIQDEWSSGLDEAPRAEPDLDDIRGLLYRNRYSLDDLGGYANHELDMGEINGLAEASQRAGAVPGFDEAAGSSQRNKRDKRTQSPAECLIINEDGFLQDVGGHAGYNKDGFYAGDAFIPPLDPNNSCAPDSGVDRDPHAYSCAQCMITFSDQASLKAHATTHRPRPPATPYTCNQCGKKFPQACNLKVHQRVHQRDGLHMCSHCAKSFTSFADLRRHRCSQGGEKPYSCALCGNNFRRLWNLKLHRRIHTQEKPHRCTMCDKSFTRADILKIHQRTHTGERPYSCRICGLTFKRLDHLRSHQRKHAT